MYKMVKIIFASVILLFLNSVLAESNINMPVGVTPLSRDIYALHMTIFWICVMIGVIVFSIMFYSLFRHRKSRGVKPAQFHGHNKVEVFWAVIPFLILVIMAIPATQVLMRMDDSAQADVNIKVTGYQWKWQYEYLDEGISFFSNLSTPQDQIQGKAPKGPHYLREVDNPLVLPIHKKIRFLVTSNDVIHSWWVPQLGIKRDAMPGFIYEAWARIDKPGIYRGQCAELCGLLHGFMPVVVVAVSEEDYAKWLASKKVAQPDAGNHTVALPTTEPTGPMTKDELMKRGETVYLSHCAMCHKADGLGMPPAFPAMKDGKVATGPVANHINLVLYGKRGTAMQAFGPQLSDADLAAVITYERNAWGNDQAGKEAGGLVQPSNIASARKNGSKK